MLHQPENDESVNKLNDLMKIYTEMMDPKVKKDRKKFEEGAMTNLDQMFDSFNAFKQKMAGN